MIELTFSQELLLHHIKEYYNTSLQYFKDNYLGLFLKEGDEIPLHAAYLCPLCVSNNIIILRDSIKTTSNFSIDHFPPKSVGGSSNLLVCTKCNNKAGHEFEFAIKEHIHHLSLGKEGLQSGITVKSAINGVGRFTSRLESNEENRWVVHLKPDAKVPIKPLDDWIEYSKTNTDWEMNITIHTPKEEHSQKSMLKTAYLYCFSIWGYEFIFSNAGEMMRKVLNGDSTYPMNVLPLKFDKVSHSNFDEIPCGVCYITNPQCLQSFVVNIKLIDKQNGYETIHPVFIPNPTETGIVDLQKVQQLMDDKIEGNIKFVPLNNILKTTPIAYSQSWYNLTNMQHQ